MVALNSVSDMIFVIIGILFRFYFMVLTILYRGAWYAQMHRTCQLENLV